MAKVYNRARMTITTTGSGTITLGSAVTNFQTFAAAGVANNDVVHYTIEDGTAWEIGTGTYTTTGTTLSRTLVQSSTGALLLVTLNAQVFITAPAAALQGGVEITGGTITGITDLAIADGGTGASTANAAMAALMGFTTTATAAGTTTLTNTSSYYQVFTGATTQTIALPSTATLALGWTFHICNNSTGNLTLNTSTAVNLTTILPGTTVMATVVDIAANTAAAWEFGFTDFSTVTGTGSVVLSAGPTFTGVPAAPTATAGTNTTQLATTAFVSAAVTAIVPVQTVFSSGSGNWTVPSVGTFCLVRLWGGGGSGGSNTGVNSGGGGGGGYAERLYKLSTLGSSGASIPYAVGAGGAAVTGILNGNPGGNSTFGSGSTLVTAYGGGGGGTGALHGNGGGITAAGSTAAAGVTGIMGQPNTSASDAVFYWNGANGNATNATGGKGFYGGGGGGGIATSATPGAGGTSVYAGAGGSGGTAGSATSGTAPAGGGGGSKVSGNSGAGGSGLIEIFVW